MSVSIEGGRVGSSCEEYLKRVIRSGIERVCVTSGLERNVGRSAYLLGAEFGDDFWGHVLVLRDVFFGQVSAVRQAISYLGVVRGLVGYR